LGIGFSGQSNFDLKEVNKCPKFNFVSNFCNSFFRSPEKRIRGLIAGRQMKNEK
jgi:hypothetical protein